MMQNKQLKSVVEVIAVEKGSSMLDTKSINAQKESCNRQQNNNKPKNFTT